VPKVDVYFFMPWRDWISSFSTTGFLLQVFFGLVYLGGLDEASLFKKVPKFLNFRHFKL